jgi:hypothetical protein
VAFREVGVHEIREVLRLWLRGEGLRSAGRLARVDRKTVRRYVAAGLACGLDPALGEGQLGDELLAAVAERVRPHGSTGRASRFCLPPRRSCFPTADHPECRTRLLAADRPRRPSSAHLQ